MSLHSNGYEDFKSQNKERAKNPQDPLNHSASLVEIADQLSYPHFGRFHCRFALSFSIIVFWIIGRFMELLGDTPTTPFHRRFDPFF
ncbi:hypothetical protein H5410_046941 [Solanum commersonii]|uniref:Uncharacterized protein n=1 Tax=Solanum commersonii TaxID=4109 RepID=A0A9J5XDP4_SOLCO|nr:hypothetical protein H5410_046941 [Solanum commersonii]